ncbi:hypothetical protein ACFL6R_00045 [Gemmatimonadota bacterium]
MKIASFVQVTLCVVVIIYGLIWLNILRLELSVYEIKNFNSVYITIGIKIKPIHEGELFDYTHPDSLVFGVIYSNACTACKKHLNSLIDACYTARDSSLNVVGITPQSSQHVNTSLFNAYCTIFDSDWELPVFQYPAAVPSVCILNSEGIVLDYAFLNDGDYRNGKDVFISMYNYVNTTYRE